MVSDGRLGEVEQLGTVSSTPPSGTFSSKGSEARHLITGVELSPLALSQGMGHLLSY